MDGIHKVFYEDIVDSVCDGCELVKIVDSGRNSHGEQIDPPEYGCPLDFEPKLVWDTENADARVWCACRDDN